MITTVINVFNYKRFGKFQGWNICLEFDSAIDNLFVCKTIYDNDNNVQTQRKKTKFRIKARDMITGW